jgi:Flp pilus assembly protein TadB
MIGVSLGVVVVCACLAGAVAAASWLAIQPRRPPLRRLLPYAEVTRSRLGVPVETMPRPVFASEAARRLLGPLASSGLDQLGRLLKVRDNDSLQRQLRQAGMTMTVEQYRRLHLRWVIASPIVCGAVGILLGSTPVALLLVAAGAFAGVRKMPDTVRSSTRRRGARCRSDLPTIAGLLSPRVYNNKSLAVAIGDLVSQGSGPIIDDLSRVLAATRTGVGLAAALDRAAEEAVDVAAARFYRFLSAATTGGIDLPKALLDQADELRTIRREEVERAAAARQVSMVIPTLVLMVPVTIVFLMAPIPKMLFGH